MQLQTTLRLGLVRLPAELVLLRAIKTAINPAGTMYPGSRRPPVLRKAA